MGLSRKLYELFRRVNTVEEFPQWVALGVFDKGAPPPFDYRDGAFETYGHVARPCDHHPDDHEEISDCCKDCSEEVEVIWMGPSIYDWVHADA